jgi:hypothetical protein
MVGQTRLVDGSPSRGACGSEVRQTWPFNAKYAFPSLAQGSQVCGNGIRPPAAVLQTELEAGGDELTNRLYLGRL